jgi:hypothetical protein
MNLETRRLNNGPRNRWKDEVREKWRNSWWSRVAGKSV